MEKIGRTHAEPPICARVAMMSTAVRRDDLCSRRHLPALRRYTAERSSVIAASGTSWMWACTTVHRVARRSATLSMCRPSGCRLIRVHRSPLVTRSTTPHSQIAAAFQPAALRQPVRPGPGVAVEQLYGIVPHHHPKVALGLGEPPVGVDKLERAAARDLKGVQLVNVPMHQHGPLVVVCSYAPCRAGQGVLDGRLGARMAKLLPLSGDETGELARFARSSRQAGPRRRPPHRGSRRQQYLQPFGEWAAQLVEGGPEALQEPG